MSSRAVTQSFGQQDTEQNPAIDGSSTDPRPKRPARDLCLFVAEVDQCW